MNQYSPCAQPGPSPKLLFASLAIRPFSILAQAPRHGLPSDSGEYRLCFQVSRLRGLSQSGTLVVSRRQPYFRTVYHLVG